MKYKGAVAALFAAEDVPLFNELGSAVVSVAVARDLLKAELIEPDATLRFEPAHPVRTTQVFDEASCSELINTNTPLGHVVKFVIGKYWVFFDPVNAARVATYDADRAVLWA